MADRVEHIVSVELDRRLEHILREIAAEHPRVSIVFGDVLDFNVVSVDCVAGNPPYSITGPLISKIVVELMPVKAVLTLQREVASRLAAKPGTKSYGRITVLVQSVYEVRLGGFYPPSAFYPPPEVSSQVVILELKRRLEPNLLRRLEEFTRCMFSQRNKRVSKVLKACCRDCPNAIGFTSDKRVYELSPEEFLQLLRLWESG